MYKFNLENFVSECENHLIDFMNENKDLHTEINLYSQLLSYVDEKTQDSKFCLEVYRELKLDKEKLNSFIKLNAGNYSTEIIIFNTFVYNELFYLIESKNIIEKLLCLPEKTENDIESFNYVVKSKFSFEDFNNKISNEIILFSAFMNNKHEFLYETSKLIEKECNKNSNEIFEFLELSVDNFEKFMNEIIESSLMNNTIDFLNLFVFSEYFKYAEKNIFGKHLEEDFKPLKEDFIIDEITNDVIEHISKEIQEGNFQNRNSVNFIFEQYFENLYLTDKILSYCFDLFDLTPLDYLNELITFSKNNWITYSYEETMSHLIFEKLSEHIKTKIDLYDIFDTNIHAIKINNQKLNTMKEIKIYFTNLVNSIIATMESPVEVSTVRTIALHNLSNETSKVEFREKMQELLELHENEFEDYKKDQSETYSNPEQFKLLISDSQYSSVEEWENEIHQQFIHNKLIDHLDIVISEIMVDEQNKQ